MGIDNKRRNSRHREDKNRKDRKRERSRHSSGIKEGKFVTTTEDAN
jgi:hypothetical protein